MLIKYEGEHEEVEVPAARALVKRGGTIDVGEALGKALCEQEANWSKAAKITKSKGTE